MYCTFLTNTSQSQLLQIWLSAIGLHEGKSDLTFSGIGKRNTFEFFFFSISGFNKTIFLLQSSKIILLSLSGK